MILKTDRVFMFNGFLIFLSEESLKILKKKYRKYYEMLLNCEITNIKEILE